MPQTTHTNAAASLHQTAELQTVVDISKLEISVSQLLGFDYIFVSGASAAMSFTHLAAARDVVMGLIHALDLTAQQTVFITVDNNNEKFKFTRHDFTWAKGSPESVQHTLINNPEQQEFITMIWQCSSIYTL